ncbi:MAG TPA: NUDIX domain-containing protein [bacterium]
MVADVRSTRRERSAGGVLAREADGRIDVCLVRRERHRRGEWCLPKGHLEPGETAEAAAVREVEEETGLTGRIVEPLGTIRYQFRLRPDGARVRKSVTFFLMAAEGSGAPGPRDQTEVVEAGWLPLAEALARAAYAGERTVLRRAGRLIEHPGVRARLSGQA